MIKIVVVIYHHDVVVVIIMISICITGKHACITPLEDQSYMVLAQKPLCFLHQNVPSHDRHVTPKRSKDSPCSDARAWCPGSYKAPVMKMQHDVQSYSNIF